MNNEYDEQEKRDYENAKREWESKYWSSRELPTPYHTEITFWRGEEDREIRFSDPCCCGCDTRDNPQLLGSLTGSNDKGEGFTIRKYDEETYNHMRKIFPHEYDEED